MLLRQFQKFGDIGRPGGNLFVDRREERGRICAGACNFKHPTSASSKAKGVHGSLWDVNKRASGADAALPIALEVQVALQHIKRFVPTVLVRRRAGTFVPLLQGDSIALGRGIGRQHPDLHADYIQGPLLLLGGKYERMAAHDLVASSENDPCVKMRLVYLYETFVSLLPMPKMKSSPQPRGPNESGRVNQKRRTRQALIEAALALREENRNPTLDEVAGRAMVSRATAYRYFPSIEALVSETATERGMKPLADIWQAGDDPVDGVGRAATELSKLLLSDEVGLHVMERSFMTVWLESASHETPLRPGRRMSYIEPIVDSLKKQLTPAARKRLKQALAIVMGTEALIAVRDISRASAGEALETTAWAARSLVRQALTESRYAMDK